MIVRRAASTVLPLHLRRCYASVGSSSAAYSTLTTADLIQFQSIVGVTNVITEADALESFNTDWMRKYRGASRLALRARRVTE